MLAGMFSPSSSQESASYSVSSKASWKSPHMRTGLAGTISGHTSVCITQVDIDMVNSQRCYHRCLSLTRSGPGSSAEQSFFQCNQRLSSETSSSVATSGSNGDDGNGHEPSIKFLVRLRITANQRPWERKLSGIVPTRNRHR